MRTVVFINSHSRRARRYLPTIQKFFATHKQFSVVDTIIIEDLDAFDDALARLQSHKKIECVMVGGGDGTVMAAVNALKHRTNITYGFLPLGTTNVYARNLGLPLSLKKSLQVVGRQHTRGVNLGSVNGMLFVNAADVGLPVQVVKRMHNRYKRFFGPFAYYLVSLRLLARAKPLRCKVQIGNDRMSIQTYDLSIINGRYYGPLLANKAGSMHDQNFTVIYGTDSSRFGFFRDVHSFVIGRQYGRRNVVMLSTSTLTVETEHPQEIQADGEVVSETPVEIKVVKNAIRVLVPPSK